ncbi:unnamed protein product [Auanema sp. JU1783]|nr:unnamed protein product [Auanema sp. JU1783]
MSTRSMSGNRRSERKRRGAAAGDNNMDFESPTKKGSSEASDESPPKKAHGITDETPSKALAKGLASLDMNSSSKKKNILTRKQRNTRQASGDENVNPILPNIPEEVSSTPEKPKKTTKKKGQDLFSAKASATGDVLPDPEAAIKAMRKLRVKPIKIKLTAGVADKCEYKIIDAHPTPYRAELAEYSDEDSTKTTERSRRGRKNVQKPTKTKEKSATLFDLRNLLHTSEVPERMPCRENEFQQIHSFLSHAVSPKGTSQVMYISGVPGTGKTASTMAVMRKMVSEGKKFISVYVNAMELMEPKLLYVQVYNGITKNTKKISPSVASNKLNAMFQVSDKKRLPIVLLVDELDQLVTKKQEIVYEVFNWTTLDEARITVIAIANTLDFPERMLSHRINSRMGANRMLFQPYSFDQISQIIRDRLSIFPDDVVAPEAVQLASQKIAAVSGDLRKAMDILRRATEIAMEKASTKVEISHVLDACKEAASTVRVGLVSNLSRHALLIFKCVVNKLGITGLDEVVFYDLYKEYCTMCRSLESIEAFHSVGVHSIVMRMCSNRLLLASPGTNMMRRRISLGMDSREAQFAIKQADDMIKNGLITYKC